MDDGYLAQVRELLALEADAILQVAGRLRAEEIERTVDLLVACRGRVIVAGIGKSGIVAQKLAATLTSIGTPAIYLHPSNALHGDLGIVGSDDVAVVISNSGETDEVLAMLPHLKSRRVPIIAIVGNLRSTLARFADAVLEASVTKEADLFNLTPTTSTTVAQAIGDAVAMTVMKTKGVSAEAFALNHPAGRLGKRLTLRVRDLMRSGTSSPTAAPDTSWLDVIRTISRGGLGAVSVADADGYLVGLITDGDLRRAIETLGLTELHSLRAHQVMTREPVVVSPDALAYDALQLMENRPSQISVLPVVDEGRRNLGLIRLHDIVRAGI
jgi:arabinose-5-phosphate isomerase